MRISDWSSDVCSSDLPDQNDGLADPLTAGVPLAGAFAHAAIRVRPASRCRSLNMCFHLIYTSRPAGVGNVAQSLPMGIRGTGDHLSLPESVFARRHEYFFPGQDRQSGV